MESSSPALSGETFDCISPVDGRLLAQRRVVRPKGRRRRGARRARPRSRAASGPIRRRKARKRILVRFADLIAKNANELALLETLDMGKPIANARNADLRAVAECVRWYGEAIDKLYDEIAPTAKTALALITREPLGVVGAVVPWNYPLMMAAWKFAPPLPPGIRWC